MKPCAGAFTWCHSRSIAKAEIDVDLAKKLQAEWGGILQWAVEGCLEWQKIGLAPPAAVRIATEQYFDDEDATGQWVEERCDKGKQYMDSSKNLFASWAAWATAAGTFVGSQKALGQRLQNLGFDEARTVKGDRGRKGL